MIFTDSGSTAQLPASCHSVILCPLKSIHIRPSRSRQSLNTLPREDKKEIWSFTAVQDIDFKNLTRDPIEEQTVSTEAWMRKKGFSLRFDVFNITVLIIYKPPLKTERGSVCISDVCFACYIQKMFDRFLYTTLTSCIIKACSSWCKISGGLIHLISIKKKSRICLVADSGRFLKIYCYSEFIYRTLTVFSSFTSKLCSDFLCYEAFSSQICVWRLLIQPQNLHKVHIGNAWYVSQGTPCLDGTSKFRQNTTIFN